MSLTLKPEYKGTPQNPTILKSQEKYKAILHGSANYAIYVHKGADWVIIDGFEVRCAANDGILCDADYTVIQNCWVRHNIGQGIIAHEVKVLYSNEIWLSSMAPIFSLIMEFMPAAKTWLSARK